jgi:hypothetical protein
LDHNNNCIVDAKGDEQLSLDKAQCAQVLSSIRLIWNQEIHDHLVESFFNEPKNDILIIMAGWFDVLKKKDTWKQWLNQQLPKLTKLIEKHVAQGKTYIQLLLPPVCEPKLKESHSPNIVWDERAYNNQVKQAVLKAGGHVIDEFSQVELQVPRQSIPLWLA